MKEWNTIIVYRTILSIAIIIVLIVLVDLIAYSIQHTGYNRCQAEVEKEMQLIIMLHQIYEHQVYKEDIVDIHQILYVKDHKQFSATFGQNKPSFKKV